MSNRIRSYDQPNFYESESHPIASELVRQGFTLSRGELLRLVAADEKSLGSDVAASVATAAVSLVAACGTLALSGLTLPILAPLAALGLAGLTAFNSRVAKHDREQEAEFLHDHPEFVERINAKLSEGYDSFTVADAYEAELHAYAEGDAERMHSYLPAGDLREPVLAAAPAETKAWNQVPRELQEPTGAIDVPSRASTSQPSRTEQSAEQLLSERSLAFDWSDLNRLYDDFPHLILLGKTGAGKTYLAEQLGRFLEGRTVVITPKKKPKDFAGMTVVGLPYDFAAIAAEIGKVAQLVKDREAEMNRTGREDFEPLNVVLDEVPAFVAGCKDEGLDVVKDLKFIIRTARTSKIRLILLAQGSEVRTLGIEGEGSLRDNLTFVRLRGFAEPRAKQLGISLAAYERPCLVDDVTADLSKLAELLGAKPAVNVQSAVSPAAGHSAGDSGHLAAELATYLACKREVPSWTLKSLRKSNALMAEQSDEHLTAAFAVLAEQGLGEWTIGEWNVHEFVPVN